ncbi:hypothetical protein LTR09_009397 [Extremus antarcticus]|uniref:Uncharacterized protein n=1 Tax=Extremus antarcticus TaxID=702011 RepID=A0AAJ0G5M5_9PEZI|nr:hypothetical protein LTR09_009397 [Extremus antarcticus]
MVVFQDKIIYMPSVPPFARSERMEDYLGQCKPVSWETRHIRSLDGTKLAICCGSLPTEPQGKIDTGCVPNGVIICYFQGNGGSLPPRLPLLSAVLRVVAAQAGGTSVILVALSPRGYWKSSGRATQSGIELDARALINHAVDHCAKPGADSRLVLWGQSIGAGVATSAAAAYLSQSGVTKPPISGLVLETPFTSIRSMLVALYPQKWLPYRHLWPFLWNHWDSETALKRIATTGNKPKILLLAASKDEVVPPEEALKLESICKELSFEYSRKTVLGALHHQASAGREGQNTIAHFTVAAIRTNPP